MATFSAMLFLFLLIISTSFSSPVTPQNSLAKDSYLFVEDPNHVLTSSNGMFSAGFYPVGNNSYCFGIWYSEPYCLSKRNCVVVWMANRNAPVNGKLSKLSLLKTGNLVLTDAGKYDVWTVVTGSLSDSLVLIIKDNGNLALVEAGGNDTLWQSFDSPTDTLLPQQPLARDGPLVSSRSRTNFSSGFYKLYFDNDNVLRLLFNGPETSSVYWPDMWSLPYEIGRSTYNSSRVALLDPYGSFNSTDNFTVYAADYGRILQRRLVLSYDGNLRLYSREESNHSWEVSWQVFFETCRIHGLCGTNSVCSYVPSSGRKCSCLPGFTMKDPSDWSSGCVPKFYLSCSSRDITFVQLQHVEFYGYDSGFYINTTLDKCREFCSNDCNCKAFQFKFIKKDHPHDIPYCFVKTMLLNGQRAVNFPGDLYLKVPKFSNLADVWPNYGSKFSMNCRNEEAILYRNYEKDHRGWALVFLLWFASGIGVAEVICVLLVWLFLIRSRNLKSRESLAYTSLIGATIFRRFDYSELKKATRNFQEEIGRGAGGVVYKAALPDGRVAAVKRLNGASQGEAEFLAEVSTIGKLNHMNLIDLWGYCAEKNHRLLVYEYLARGSLAENLAVASLDWSRRFDIAVGTAKGLAYLHEECLEWVLHCDVKPQNILLDSRYVPKVSDFGLSRLLSRGDITNSSFSRIRGTRGYMAPEWISRLPITSKVDVFSFGIVVLEMVTGRNPTKEVRMDSGEGIGAEHRSFVAWLKEKQNGGGVMASWVAEVIDPILGSEYDADLMGTLVSVALDCVEEEIEARPTMREVVEMLISHKNNDAC